MPNTRIFNLPFWSAPFGQVLLDNIDYNSRVERILDIGFGGGFPLLELSNRFYKTTQVFGIDVDEQSVNELNLKIQGNNIANVTVIEANAERIPFQNLYFDLIVSNNGINNVENADVAILECSRVCNTNGEFVFTFNLNDTYSDFYKVFTQVLEENNCNEEIDRLNNHIDKKRPKLEIIKTYLEKAGFKQIEVIQSHFNMSFSNGSALFNHYFISEFFLPDWKSVIPEHRRKKIFDRLENKLNLISKNQYLKFGVPFVCINCKKR